jgi:hypothetical protein
MPDDIITAFRLGWHKACDPVSTRKPYFSVNKELIAVVKELADRQAAFRSKSSDFVPQLAKNLDIWWPNAISADQVEVPGNLLIYGFVRFGKGGLLVSPLSTPDTPQAKFYNEIAGLKPVRSLKLVRENGVWRMNQEPSSPSEALKIA